MKVDRRDALKKLAVGGVTVGAASAVISSPVFADDTPIPPADRIVNASVNPPYTLNVTLSPGIGNCDGTTSAVANVHSSSITLSATPGTITFTGNEDSVAGDGSLLATFTITDNGVPSTAFINYFANYQCTSAGGSIVLCTLRTIRFDSSGVANDWSTSASVTKPTADFVCLCTPSGWNSVCPPVTGD